MQQRECRTVHRTCARLSLRRARTAWLSHLVPQLHTATLWTRRHDARRKDWHQDTWTKQAADTDTVRRGLQIQVLLTRLHPASHTNYLYKHFLVHTGLARLASSHCTAHTAWCFCVFGLDFGPIHIISCNISTFSTLINKFKIFRKRSVIYSLSENPRRR